MAKNPTDPEGNEAAWALGRRIAEVFIDGWLIMLVMGVLHASAKNIPAFGYWQCLFAGWVLAGVVFSGVQTVDTRLKKLAKLVLP